MSYLMVKEFVNLFLTLSHYYAFNMQRLNSVGQIDLLIKYKHEKTK